MIPSWPWARPQTIERVDVMDWASVERAIAQVAPEVVVNCAGVVKQIAAAHDAVTSITVNALFPWQLASLCTARGARLIHVGTDCVFSGKKGRYIETDFPDAYDLYGRTKFLGEVASPHLTLRTSIIGHELRRHTSLIDWFFAQRGQRIKGFTKAIYSGFPTVVFAEIVAEVIARHPQLEGLYHVASAPIDKCTLLNKLRAAFDLPIEIVPDDTLACDRSLNGARFQSATGYAAPTWDVLIERMVQDEHTYTHGRQSCS